MEDIQKRLERLERSVRYSKVLVIAMAVCTVAFATVPKARSLGSPFPLAASEFDLLGPGGKITAKLTTNDGGPNLLFYDNNGKVVWVADGYVDRALLPQSSEPFAVEVPKSLAGKVQNFHVVVNQYSLSRS